ncbi:MAG: glycosyltransferase family 9 protein [Candidatus Omnitrophica bacterium]|nr:glycosyltransferase family 9 protein [Candidatus Omnitrophota bacterium]
MRSIRHILVVQPYGIGDALFMTPLLRALRTLPTVETVDLLLGSRTESVFQNNPHVDQIFSIDKEKWHHSKSCVVIQDLLSLWKNLRGRYDLLIDLSLQREYGFFGGLFLQIPRRIGFNFKKRGTFLTQSLPLPHGFHGAHAVDFYCELGKLIGLEIEDRFLEFYLADQDRKDAEQMIQGRYLAVALGGGESWGKDAFFKRWPVDHFAELISKIKDRVEFEQIVILGSSGEKELGERIEEKLSFPVHNLCGELSLGLCAALLEKSLLFLANDGGLVHLAHSLHVPLIAFFGPVDPKVYGPYPLSSEALAVVRENLPCRPCYFRFRYNSACVDRECLSALTPEEVLRFLDQKNFWPILCKEKSSFAS